MAFASPKADGGEAAPMSDMNVTPLVDVMLVLLIVFMVAAPLMATGVPVDLPKAQTKPLNEQKPPIAVSIDSSGKFFVDQSEVASEELVYVLGQNAESKDRRIHVRGDKSIAYGKVIEVMGLINSAGYTKVALVSEAPGPASPATVAPTATVTP
ncbi:protein TolR [Beijerinckia mobilis]|uniref:protein TolR n=1 Tax=Beijerinckia mobilis TaxID=231434 RepID=UPI000556B6DF|nr:protein TolR [Beijerinckia mobilis]